MLNEADNRHRDPVKQAYAERIVLEKNRPQRFGELVEDMAFLETADQREQ